MSHDEPAMPEGEERPPAGVRTMAAVRWGIVCVMALVAIGSVVTHFGVFSERGAHQDERVYTCPMHPQIVQDHPGECPICGMDLVPRETGVVAAPDDAGLPGLAPVELPADRVQLIGMKTAKATRQALASEISAAGVVSANERGLAQIAPRFSGWIDRLLVEETGARVTRGQVVATIYSPELLQAQQELIAALGWAAAPVVAPSKHAGHSETAADLVQDARLRLELLGISRSEIDAIIRDRRPRTAIELRSPVAGHVVVKNAVVGMAVQPGVPLFEVADLSSVWIVGEIFESDASRVRVGQAATFRTNTYPGETFAGKVQFVSPSVETASRTLRVRIEMKNRTGPGAMVLRPGMFGTVALALPASEGLVVPAEAVVDTGERQHVFVDRGGGRYEPRRVQLGARAGGNVVVTQGLSDGEEVVTTSNFLIDSESRLRAAIEGHRP